MALNEFPKFIQQNYELHEWRHASSILKTDFPVEYADVLEVLSNFRLIKNQVEAEGGNKSKLAGSLDGALVKKGWIAKTFETAITVDNETRPSPTHEVDCFKNRIALEIEWNNKDPFFDRDLNNFRLLFDLRVISLGIVITRSTELMRFIQSNDKKRGRETKTGMSTTHMDKLLPRIEGGGGGGCPILAFGIKSSLYVEK